MNKPKEILELEKIYAIRLTKIALSNADIYSIRNRYQLNNNKEIVGLNLSGNKITEIKGLEQLKQLRKLSLHSNQITDIKGLKQLTQLQKLSLHSNQIADIKDLEQLTQLQYLNLNHNQITDIKVLGQLTQLQYLNLNHNQITDIKVLEQLTQLQELWLFGNRFSEPQLKTGNNLDTVRKYFLDKNKKKIFVSYSKEDKKEKEEFIKQTVTLQEQGIITKPWTDEWIEFGQEWDNEIKRQIKECDIMVCLISDDFLNTEYIRKTELKEAMKQGKILIPIIIKPCDWENCDFAKYQVALKGKCLSYNENENRENTTVERKALWKEVIKEMRKKNLEDNV
jgi:hypothetical protein